MSKSTRRSFLKAAVGVTASAVGVSAANGNVLLGQMRSKEAEGLCVDPEPKFELSPNLYMQFMEPLGKTDGSVEAAWDFGANHWREDVIDVTARLGPPLIRFGGCFSSYYRWKDGIGPRNQRKPMHNLLWRGIETNQVGTHEFVDFCRQVKAQPFYCVNFESDGRKHWMKAPNGDVTTAGPEEAAEWVDYCNNPDNSLRRSHGVDQPYDLKLWQIGNETSYDPNAFDVEQAGTRTVAFAKAMRNVDSSIDLIGWGDSGWAKRMNEVAGEHLQYLAFHHMFHPDQGKDTTPLRGNEYRKDPDCTWESLMGAWKHHDGRIRRIREDAADSSLPLALTECHFALPGRNRCEVLSSWAAGVAMARLANVNERHGDRLKIATLADFCGTRWQVNAVMIPVPNGQSFMMPVAKVMSLYRHHVGGQAIEVKNAPDDLDVTASITDNRVYLHVVNTLRTRSVKTPLAVNGKKIVGGEVFALAADPEHEVMEHDPNVLEPVKQKFPADGTWTFPAASVTAVELDIESV